MEGLRMKFHEAMKHLVEGKSVRRKAWDATVLAYCPQFSNSSMQFTALDMMADDWELYEEPEKLLTFAEVVKGLKEGKKFQRLKTKIPIKCFPNFPSIYWDDPNRPFYFSPTIEDIEATDWIEVL